MLRAFVIQTKEIEMHITVPSNELRQSLAAPASVLQSALANELDPVNSWAQRIARIEEALSDARETRRAARSQLLKPALPGSARASNETLYFNACEIVAQWEQQLDDALNADY
nr:hypothetical protein [Methylocella tundrae]